MTGRCSLASEHLSRPQWQRKAGAQALLHFRCFFQFVYHLLGNQSIRQEAEQTSAIQGAKLALNSASSGTCCPAAHGTLRSGLAGPMLASEVTVCYSGSGRLSSSGIPRSLLPSEGDV